MNAPSYSTSYIAGTYTPVDRRELAEHGFTRRRGRPRFHAPIDLGDLADDLFAVADHERVDVLGERLGVVRAVPARDHDRVLGPAVLVAHRAPPRGRRSSSRFV